MPADFDATRHLMSTAQADWDDHIGRRKPPCPECERLRAERDALLALLKETIPQLSIYDGLRSRVHAAIDAAKARDRD